MDNKQAMQETKKPWGGRFSEATDKLVEAFSCSVHFDKRLAPYDIQASIVHAKMLAKQGIITQKDADDIEKGLKEILFEIEAGTFEWQAELEDVHMNIERRLSERIGEAGKRLHTARSRNDQVATDIRLYLRHEIDETIQLIKGLQRAFLSLANAYPELIMPGYTHLQKAQPVLWAHHFLAYCEMFERDIERLSDCRKRVNICPLGSAALAGSDFPIDRGFVAKELGFERPSANSMDSVADRDFIVEFLAAASLIMAHLSRLSEELILWSSDEFRFIELPDAFCTGSSIMPQKKNPDVPELVRGKTGRVYGSLIAILTLLKGLPMTYNRDLQEDKEPLFDTIDTIKPCLLVMMRLVARIKPRTETLNEHSLRGFLTATDLADYLVQKGVAFRDAHEIVGKVVGHCVKNGLMLNELDLTFLKDVSNLIEDDALYRLTPEGSVQSRNSLGGTAFTQVKEAIKTWGKRLS